MDINKNKVTILERIKGPSHGPGSIVTQESGVSAALIGKLQTDLLEAGFIPIAIRCDGFDSPLEFWKQAFFWIWEGLLPYMDEKLRDTMTEQLYDDSASADDTSDISTNLGILLEEIKEKKGITACLIFEPFDDLIMSQEEPDAMKVRGLTSIAAVLTISRKTLATLTGDKYNDNYFCNQFIQLNIE